MDNFVYWHPQRRFGMFIHWGAYSLSEWHEQYQMRAAVPRAQYERLCERFDPRRYDPEAWVRLAKEAGMRYICFTAKHHDGFCMWDTKQTGYNIMNSPYGRDALKQLSDACARHDIALCLYYSIPDWHHPNAYNPKSTHQIPPRMLDKPDMEEYKAYIKRQITELLTGYGRIWALFWDIPPQMTDPSLNELARFLQPGIMINDRGFSKGDYSTPERFVPDGMAFSSPTEACQSVGRQSWGYRKNEDYYSLLSLTSSIDRTMAMGGNYLLNVGPTPEGEIPPRAEASVRAVGSWYARVREAFEGAQPCSRLFGRKDLLFTRKGESLYVHFCKSPECTGFALDPVATPPEKVTVLNNGAEPSFALDTMPTLYQLPGGIRPFLHIYDLPADELAGEAVVLRLDFASLDAALAPCSGESGREAVF